MFYQIFIINFIYVAYTPRIFSHIVFLPFL